MSTDREAPRCPYCDSADVITSPKPSPSSYWRCKRCGELWHPDRIGERNTYSGASAPRARALGR